MKILVLENPEEHRNSPTANPRTIYPSLERSISSEGGESELVKNLEDADLRLQKGDIDAVIIHHYRKDDIINLRKKYPNMKFAAISALIYAKEKCKPGCFPEEFRKALEPHYDFLLHDYALSVWDMMRQIQEAKK